MTVLSYTLFRSSNVGVNSKKKWRLSFLPPRVLLKHQSHSEYLPTLNQQSRQTLLQNLLTNVYQKSRINPY